MKIHLARIFIKNENIINNYNKIIQCYNQSLEENCDLLIFPEMALTGCANYEKNQDLKFIFKYNIFLEKIVEYTKNKKTAILLGCPYFIEKTIINEIIHQKQFFKSTFLIKNGYIKAISSKTSIAKNNIFNDYFYFDKEIILKDISYEDTNFDLLMSDDINENKNILFIKERNNNFIICLDSEKAENLKNKKEQLIKIAKWTQKDIIYMNSLSYDIKTNSVFYGEILIINKLGNIVYKNFNLNEEILRFETKIINGEMKINYIFHLNDEKSDFISILAKNYHNKNIIYEVNNKNYKLSKITKNIKYITFNKELATNAVLFINIKDFLSNIEVKDKNQTIQNIIFNKLFKNWILLDSVNKSFSKMTE